MASRGPEPTRTQTRPRDSPAEGAGLLGETPDCGARRETCRLCQTVTGHPRNPQGRVCRRRRGQLRELPAAEDGAEDGAI